MPTLIVSSDAATSPVPPEFEASGGVPPSTHPVKAMTAPSKIPHNLTDLFFNSLHSLF